MQCAKAVDRVWGRSEKAVDIIVNKLRFKFYYLTNKVEELKAEAQLVFYKLFYEKYETDEQYLRFFFIVIKNRFHDLNSRENRYHSVHVSTEVLCQKYNHDDGDDRVYTDIAVHEDPDLCEGMDFDDKVDEILDALPDALNRTIFRFMIFGHRVFEIAKLIDYSPGYVSHMRKEYIWPVVKKVMNIPDDAYEELIDSGRIPSM